MFTFASLAVSSTLEAATAAASSPALPPTRMLWLIGIIILAALIFDFLNGFHDADNSIAIIVSTRVLSPTQAVIWAGFFNFIAAFLFGTGVAQTIGTGLVSTDIVDVYVVLGGLTGAIVWNLTTWLLALPTSSSHALVAGIAGAAIAKNGFGVLIWSGWWSGWGAILLFIVLAPAIGFLLGSFFMIAISWVFRYSTPSRVDKTFRRLQLVSAAMYSLGHGANDAQKTMGIIVMLLASVGMTSWSAPDPNSIMNSVNFLGHEHKIAWWIILTCHAAIALGTCFGGWRIVKTMGSGITRLQPVGGFAAESAAATTIIFATWAKIPISTTHAITGAILGVGTTKSIRSVRWIWGQRIVTAWVLTLPCAALIAAVSYLIIHHLLRPYFS